MNKHSVKGFVIYAAILIGAFLLAMAVFTLTDNFGQGFPTASVAVTLAP